MNIIVTFNISFIILSAFINSIKFLFAVKPPVFAWSGKPKPFNRNKKLIICQKKLDIILSDKKTPCLVKCTHVSSECTSTLSDEPNHQATKELCLVLHNYPTKTTKASTLKNQQTTDQDMKSKATAKSTSTVATGTFFYHRTTPPSHPKRIVPNLITLFENISSKNPVPVVHHHKPNLISKPKITTGVSLVHIQNTFKFVDYKKEYRSIADYEATLAANILNGRRYITSL